MIGVINHGRIAELRLQRPEAGIGRLAPKSRAADKPMMDLDL
jgi:hypothetical protein